MTPLAKQALERAGAQPDAYILKASAEATLRGQSRHADKFVVRLPDGLRERVDAAASAEHRSMNSVAVIALLQYLDNQNQQRILLNALAAQLAGIGGNHSELKAAALAADVAKCADESEYGRRLRDFYEEVTPEAVLELIAENELLMSCRPMAVGQ